MIGTKTLRLLRRAAVFGTAILASTLPAHGAAPFIWIEGERPANANFGWTAAGVERSELLSEGRWLIGSERVKLPDDGHHVTYAVEVDTPATYNLWLRVGFEWVRANVDWRVDDGNWTAVGMVYGERNPNREKVASRPAPDIRRRTTNVKDVGYWNEVAWLNVGEVRLAAGNHTLQLRFTRTHLADPIVAVDAIAFVAGRWTPEGSLRPGETYDGDLDRGAARHAFELPSPGPGATRTEIELTGPWQVARYDDPDMNVDTYEPVRGLPDPGEYTLSWMGVRVPSSAWQQNELRFGHRLIYRTRIRVPAAHGGRGFRLHFSGTNWIVGVLINGKFAGEHTGVWIPWDLDVSDFVKPGEVNELVVTVKGSYYAHDPEAAHGDLTLRRNVPKDHNRWSRWVAPIYPSSKGDGEGIEYGIVNPVRLISVGDAYAEDVFVKPSVARGELAADVTVRNTAAATRRLAVRCEAVHDRTGEVEHVLPDADLVVRPASTSTVTVRGAWEDPKLWWPVPEPHLYRLRTTILENGKPVDVEETLFGFREVTVEGPAILINGVRRNFWNWVGVPDPVGRPEDYERQWREQGSRFMRFSYGRRMSRVLKTRQERLEYYDRHGMPGRLCSMIDGMFINFNLGRGVRQGNDDVFAPNEKLWEGFRRHVSQLTKAYRNHPSVIMYQIENELVYINGMNLYGGLLPGIEREMLKVYEAGKANDPTRPYTVGGGGDLSRAEGLADPSLALEVNCPHYPSGDVDWYPENAYTIERYTNKISRWPWTRKKPWVVGESAHAHELELGSYAAGPVAFRSQDDAKRGKARYLRMLYGGYRWAGVAGFFPWDILSDYEDGRKTFSDLCVIPRRQTHRLYGGRRNEILVKIMNDTLSDAPVTFAWTYDTDGKRIAGERKTLTITPGYGLEQTLVIAPPEVSARRDGTLTVTATQPGAAGWEDVRSVPVLPYLGRVPVRETVLLFDRSGRVAPFFTETGISFGKIERLEALAGARGVLVVGPDTLSVEEARGRALLTFAARGGRVIALEQENPLCGGNLPMPMTPTQRFGGYAHPQALGSPLFADLRRDDLIDWASGHPTYKNPYVKPTQGGRSLVECGPLLPYSALVEAAAGDGVLVLCQLRVGAGLRRDPASDLLLRNLLTVYADYRPPRGVTAVPASSGALLARAVAATGVLQARVDSIAAALDPRAHKIALIDATPASMRALLAARPQAEAFQDGGGWIVLSNVGPQTIDAFNELVGVDHLLRPFRLERVYLADRDAPLAATLGDGDVMLYSPEWIAQWAGKRWISGNTFSYVIDGDNAGPFTYPPGAPQEPYAYTPSRDDKDPYNFVNGLLNKDFWKYIRQIYIPESGPAPLVFTLRRSEMIQRIHIWNNANYGTIEDLDVVFDDGEPIRIRLPDAARKVTREFDPPRRAQRTITLQIRSWRTRPETNPQPRLVGIDNVEFIRARRPSSGLFLDSAGGLVAFPRGAGGVFLCQIKFLEDEPLGENRGKKIALLSKLLGNMGAGTQTTKVPVAGLNVRFQTIDITDSCNRFLYTRSGKSGWFGRRGQDLARLPVGRRHFADVEYHIVDFSTSPVPDCIMLGGLRGAPEGLEARVTGIPVNGKADVLFFLHTARVTRPIHERERDQLREPRSRFQLPEVLRYVLHYADGEKHEIHVILERHIDHWLQEKPTDLEQAAVAWSAPLGGADSRHAVLYGMQAANPRPHVAISSIDVTPGLDRENRPANRAVPAVIAITLGKLK